MKAQAFCAALGTNLVSVADHTWYYRPDASWKANTTELLQFLTFL